MTKVRGLRIATAGGALLVDPDILGEGAPSPSGAEIDALFEPALWKGRGELVDVTGGRGAAWFIASAARQWALRHYRRGGFIARLSKDGYVWAGEERVRSFAEWRLLADLVRRGLPVPAPIAARYRRQGLLYRCDLITRRIADARPLSAELSVAPLQESAWRDVGATVAKLHAAGADHADLNAHNILRDAAGAVSVIDFDRGKLRAGPGRWESRNLSRLRRSLLKVTRDLPPDRFPAAAWEWLLAGYASAHRR
ncbi:MAG: 3-deoxy-D-manno-octulosonic acid kinase [Pseudomonadota bacterium]|nr:3-deoxy-D-manno-octulosonic acid kinase [Pseudomonadota bacterium]